MQTKDHRIHKQASIFGKRKAFAQHFDATSSDNIFFSNFLEFAS